MVLKDFAYYSTKYNNLNGTNYIFTGNISIDYDIENIQCINVHLVVIENNEICYDFSKEFFVNNDVDIVLNMAGKKHDVFLSKINESDYDGINDMIDVNIKGNINIVSTCLPKMIEKKYGRIISISSTFTFTFTFPSLKPSLIFFSFSLVVCIPIPWG